MYMTHRMRPIFPTKFAGYALTVRLKKEANNDPEALKGMLSTIDQGAPDSVYVMVLEEGIDIAGMGGLWGQPWPRRNFRAPGSTGACRAFHIRTKTASPEKACESCPATSHFLALFCGQS